MGDDHQPSVASRTQTGFTISAGGRLGKLLEVHWTTRRVGEF